MQEEHCITYRFQQQPSDIFFQTLLQDSCINSEWFASDTPVFTLSAIQICQSQDVANQPSQNNDIKIMLDLESSFNKKEQLYSLIPASYLDDDQLLEGRLSDYSSEGPVLKSKQSAIFTYRCPYTAESRQIKIQRYRQKKQRRVWERKVSYNSRRQMAHMRLRVKGRFVKRQSPTSSAAESHNYLQTEQQGLSMPIEAFVSQGLQSYLDFQL